ncbi:tyrosine-protein phosphatase [Cytophaga aurantiaca]|uniref:tyrosine-protein phosphatase n=1 Tax=Cytophaga aurantiaca TaxID=29530 RepID=UPI00036EA92B|nr:CpsB/CapC family capsule biosynthesis tyrosine phosphatase [Cytophaga aurantiaca]
MSFLTSLFGKKEQAQHEDFIFVDMHSHLIPKIDDGSKSLDESVELIKKLVEFGYKKIITSPHIMGDFYKNTPEIILGGLSELKQRLKSENIEIEIDAAAEYYLDEWFIEKLNKNEPLLTFGKKYVLFETSYMNEPAHLHQAIFSMRTLGYTPVLAHPERYLYLYNDFSAFEKIYEMDVLFQINLNSLMGYYSKPAKQFAEKLIDNKMVDFVGTDCHGMRHLNVLKDTRASKYYNKLANLNLLNNTLLS